MSKYYKKLIAKMFCILSKENNKYITFIATDIYGMGVDNPDINLGVQ